MEKFSNFTGFSSDDDVYFSSVSLPIAFSLCKCPSPIIFIQKQPHNPHLKLFHGNFIHDNSLSISLSIHIRSSSILCACVVHRISSMYKMSPSLSLLVSFYSRWAGLVLIFSVSLHFVRPVITLCERLANITVGQRKKKEIHIHIHQLQYIRNIYRESQRR